MLGKIRCGMFDIEILGFYYTKRTGKNITYKFSNEDTLRTARMINTDFSIPTVGTFTIADVL